MKRFSGVVLAVSMMVMAGCGPKLSKAQYIQVMTELGCGNLSEIQPGAQEIFKKLNVTQDDINQFRIKGDREDIVTAATEIATKVAACHGIQYTP